MNNWKENPAPITAVIPSPIEYIKVDGVNNYYNTKYLFYYQYLFIFEKFVLSKYLISGVISNNFSK